MELTTASPRRFKISFTFGGMVAVSKDILFIECFNWPRPLPFDIYINLDIYFYAILINLIVIYTFTCVPDASVLPTNAIVPDVAVIVIKPLASPVVLPPVDAD